jgi:DNA-binding response OmpR family regulator
MARHILLIDDDESLRKALSRILQRNGYQVTTAVNGRQGIDMFAMDRFDLVITDMFMPDRDGLDVVLQLTEHNPAVKIITMSGGSQSMGENQFYLDASRDLGAMRSMKKPFSNDELLFAVEALLER